MKEVLVCGHRSYVATGLTTLLADSGITFDCFSRGTKQRTNNIITGDVLQMADNDLLDNYKTVVNFIILKDRTVDENLKYINELLEFCKNRKVENLIQISSISAYPNDLNYVDETTAIESDYNNKGAYGGIKVAVDNYLEQHKIDGLNVIFVRPGFVYSKDKKASMAGITKKLGSLNVLLGDKKTSMPLINKTTLHKALIEIILSKNKQRVYLILNNDSKAGTKYNFVKEEKAKNVITLPRLPFMLAANVLKKAGILKKRHYQKISGVFKRTQFNSSKSEENLNMKFGKREFCVMGAGTFGSYVSNLLSIKYPHEKIYLYDVGDDNLKDESEIGYLSRATKFPYVGLQKGRFFGYGGASVKWGGQILTFSDKDFKNPTKYLSDIVELNIKYKDKVLSRFNLKNTNPEKELTDKIHLKTGIWLSYFHRNLFKHFKINKNKQIEIIPHSRVTKILSDGNNHITGIEIIQNGVKKIVTHDHYFLTSGAFETGRILLNSGLTKDKSKFNFSDHLSQKVFFIKSGPKIGNEDFTFNVKGASLITKRLVGEVNGYSFYSQPVLNEDFEFFQNLKKLLFGHKYSLGIIKSLIRDIPCCIDFAWNIFVKKKMYIYKNQFYLQIDLENPIESGVATLYDSVDKYGEKGISVDFDIDDKTFNIFKTAKSYIKEYLDKNNVDYEEIDSATVVEKYEDVYHPSAIFAGFDNVKDYFHHFNNMLVVTTGILPRSGGINTTGAVFPLVEEYIQNEMS